MKISLNLKDSDAEIATKILSSIKDILNPVMHRAAQGLSTIIPTKVREALMAEPEYQSLVSGKLKYEFGIPDSATQVNNIIDIWSNSISISIIPMTISGNSLRGGIKINIIRSDFSDVLSSNSATVQDPNTSATLPWLEWLLLYGNKIIIQNYQVKFGPNQNSRTGMAIMVSSNKENWRVPAEFAGVAGDNWVTRALSRLESSIPSLIQNEIEKNI